MTEDWELLGQLMNENHAIQRDLGGSGDSNERLIDGSFAAGTLGAKLAGAGDGGTIIALWPGDNEFGPGRSPEPGRRPGNLPAGCRTRCFD